MNIKINHANSWRAQNHIREVSASKPPVQQEIQLI